MMVIQFFSLFDMAEYITVQNVTKNLIMWKHYPLLVLPFSNS